MRGIAEAIIALTSLLLGISLWFMLEVWTADAAWISVYAFLPSLSLHSYFDKASATMLFVVSLVSFSVMLYTYWYASQRAKAYRIFIYLLLFLGAMWALLWAGDLLSLFFAWEWLGICSFLLVAFERHKSQSVAMALRVFLYNRIGDMGFLLAILMAYAEFGTLHLETLRTLTLAQPWSLFWIGGGLVFAASAKSAQVLFAPWLPSAMVAPTPVSALLHAATMVTAGVYVLLRCYFLLTPDLLFVLSLLGGITAIWGALYAFFQFHAKKLLAGSTVSQLGFMFLALGAGAPSAAYFHLLTHAFFKALLFLCIGVIAKKAGTYDMRKMGGLRKAFPLVFILYSIAAASMAGLPLLSGSLSKELILAHLHTQAFVQGGWSWIFLGFGIISALLTVLYIGRQLSMVFLGEVAHTAPLLSLKKYNMPFYLTLSLLLLAIGSTAFVFSYPPLSPLGSPLLPLFSARALSNSSLEISLLVALGLLAIGSFLIFKDYYPRRSYRLAYLLEAQHSLYVWLFVRPVLIVSGSLSTFDSDYLDRGIDAVALFHLRIAKWVRKVEERIFYRGIRILGESAVVLGFILAWIDRYIIDGIIHSGLWIVRQCSPLIHSDKNTHIQYYLALSLLLAILGLIAIVFGVG
ncbi:MAG: hypothetical protein JJT94_11310 [Bernardetiaceae bacterium]|nr:hypothetical protein [Bernardetiaceae bacterium]